MDRQYTHYRFFLVTDTGITGVRTPYPYSNFFVEIFGEGKIGFKGRGFWNWFPHGLFLQRTVDTKDDTIRWVFLPGFNTVL